VAAQDMGAAGLTCSCSEMAAKGGLGIELDLDRVPAREAGTRIGLVVMATILGMAAGGWMSGWIYDMTGSYQAAFLNGIAWNFLNIGVMALIFFNARRRSLLAT